MATLSHSCADVRTGTIGRRVLQDKNITLRVDGVAVATAVIQFMRPSCPNPNFEFYTSLQAAKHHLPLGGVAYGLTYVMIKEVLKTDFRTMTVKSAHGGVLALLQCRFIIVSESRVFRGKDNAKRLHQCDMVCIQPEIAAGYCAEKLEKRYPGMVFA